MNSAPSLLQFLGSAKAPRMAAEAKGRIALGQEQEANARKEGFIVDDVGNAIRILTET